MENEIWKTWYALLYYVNIYNIKMKHRVYGVVTKITNVTSKT